MLRKTLPPIGILALLAVVPGAAVTAIRTSSRGPVWAMAWLPAVLATASSRRSSRRCRR